MRAIRGVLIIGGSGFLGAHLARRLRDGYRVFASYNRNPIQIPGVTCVPVNVENRVWVKKLVYAVQPDVVIYAAGPSRYEQSSARMRLADRVYAAGAATVQSATDILQPRFIYLSTPYVFDGTKGNYHEGDVVLPGTTAGKAKLAGENIVRAKSLSHVVIRCSPVYGRSFGANLTLLDQLRVSLGRGERVHLPTNELHSWSPVETLADLVARVIEYGIRNKVLHFGGLTKINTFDFGKAFAKRFGYDPNLILPQTRSARDRHLIEEQVVDYSLNSTLSSQTLKVEPLLLEQGFDLIEKHLIPRA